jgi:hypothetical protein
MLELVKLTIIAASKTPIFAIMSLDVIILLAVM